MELMFDIERLGLITAIRCRNCPASLTIESDSHVLITRRVADYQKRHRCRNIRSTEEGHGKQGKILRQPENRPERLSL